MLAAMRKYNHVRELDEEERVVLVKGAKSPAGFTMRRSQILLLSAEGRRPSRLRSNCTVGTKQCAM